MKVYSARQKLDSVHNAGEKQPPQTTIVLTPFHSFCLQYHHILSFMLILEFDYIPFHIGRDCVRCAQYL